MSSRKASRVGNFAGAFADTGTLIPLVAALSISNGFSIVVLLASAGIAYFVAALLFRIPMSVQPLKSVAVAAVALEASKLEVQVSAALLGVVCLLLIVCGASSSLARIPKRLVHGVQLGLGVLLVIKGLEMLNLSSGITLQAGMAVLAVSLILLGSARQLPTLGLFAMAGLILAFIVAEPHSVAAVSSGFRVEIVLALLLPQIVLTATNSVVATEDVAKRYYGDSAERVSIKRLLQSIGIGNIIFAAFGGLPFCHGSGGLTAHFRGGSSHWYSNAIIGTTLIILSILYFLCGSLALSYPIFLLAALLITVGLFHIKLAAPSWEINSHRSVLIVMAIAALLTRNMLWVLVAGLAVELWRYLMSAQTFQAKSRGA